MKKKIQRLKSDKQAEAFLAKDLSTSTFRSSNPPALNSRRRTSRSTVAKHLPKILNAWLKALRLVRPTEKGASGINGIVYLLWNRFGRCLKLNSGHNSTACLRYVLYL